MIAHSVTINTAGYTFSGGSLTVTAGGIQINQSATIDSDVYIGGPQAWTVAAAQTLTVNGPLHTIISDLTFSGAGNTVISGVIDGGGVMNTFAGATPGSLIQAGTGDLTLTGPSNYAGNITVNAGAGTLYLTPPSGVTSTYSGQLLGAGAVVVGGAGTVALAGPSNFTGTINVQTGTLTFAPPSGVAGTYSCVISGGSIQQSGPGTTILTGGNTYSGTTTISNGAIQADSGVGLPTASILTLDGGVLQGNVAGTFTVIWRLRQRQFSMDGQRRRIRRGHRPHDGKNQQRQRHARPGVQPWAARSSGRWSSALRRRATWSRFRTPSI